jgi:hypothetical protein
MMEFPDPGDLPVPPRTTPAVVLGLMFAVALGCSAVLIWPRPPDKVQGDTVSARAEASAHEAMIAKARGYSSAHKGR